jgi:SAM-dependent methyltransferase
MKLEQAPCDLCGSTEVDLVATLPDPERIAPGEFDVVLCRHCGLQFVNPRPDKSAIGTCYPVSYYAFSGHQKNVQRPTLRKKIKAAIRSSRALSTLASYLPGVRAAAIDTPFEEDFNYWMPTGAILEVGCGSGGVLDIMQNNGWRTVGIEPSSEAALLAQENGHQIFVLGGDDEYPEGLTQQRFDLIYLSHSLEHMHFPTRSLNNLGGLLKRSTGRMVIEVPNAESLLTYLFGEMTPIYDVPRHLYFFSPDTLSAMLKKAGYRIESMRVFSRPNQFVRCFKSNTRRFSFVPWQLKADKNISSPEFLAAMKSLSKYAEQANLGAAIRVVVSRPD